MIDYQEDIPRESMHEQLVQAYFERVIRDLHVNEEKETWVLEYFAALLNKYIREKTQCALRVDIKLNRINELGKRMYEDHVNFTTDGEREQKVLQMDSMVNNPKHYAGKNLEAIEVIEDFSLGFNLGNVIKYVLRCDKKGNKKEDIEKAIFYLKRERENMDK